MVKTKIQKIVYKHVDFLRYPHSGSFYNRFFFLADKDEAAAEGLSPYLLRNIWQDKHLHAIPAGYMVTFWQACTNDLTPSNLRADFMLVYSVDIQDNKKIYANQKDVILNNAHYTFQAPFQRMEERFFQTASFATMTRYGVERFLHYQIWRNAHGDIPHAHYVVHVDRNPENNNLSNLKLISEEVLFETYARRVERYHTNCTSNMVITDEEIIIA